MAGRGTDVAPQELFNSIAELAEEPHDIALVAVNAITDESEMRAFLEEYAAFLEG